MVGGTTGSVLMWIGLATVAGAVGGTVLVTSGPLAPDGDNSDPSLQQPSNTPSAAAATRAPTPAGATTAVDGMLDRDEPYDPAVLPHVDTRDWVTYTGPNGTLRLSAPPDWEVRMKDQLDVNGNVIGDSFKVLAVAQLTGRPPRPVGFSAEPGDVWADIRTEPAPVTFSTEEPIFAERRDSETIAGGPAEIVATQFFAPSGFDPGVGALTLSTSFRLANKHFAVAAIHIALPADLQTIALASEILRSISAP